MLSYDFIVVGGGPSGAAVASRLAKSSKAPSVLLLEAGGENKDPDATPLADRYNTFMTHPNYNWNYSTVPQKHLLNRELYYPRGKGLGGSSAINFAFYTRGASEDSNEWARQVGDEFFDWKNAERRFKKFENYGPVTNHKQLKYVDPSSEHHDSTGPVAIEFSTEWEKGIAEVLEGMREHGLPPNLDINSGNPIGNGLCPATGREGRRTTAATAYLSDTPKNLKIVTGAYVSKVLFEGKQAVGVQFGNDTCFAKNDVILSGGALDTPKLLLLSGVGPAHELSKHGISAVVDLPGVGKNLQDHPQVPITVRMKDGFNNRKAWLQEEALKAAREQFEKDGTGPLSILYQSCIVGFFKGSEELMHSKEFTELSEDVRKYINHPTVPTWEQACYTPALSPLANPAHTYLTVIAFGMSVQSRGSVSLASSNPADPPLCDPNFMSHPFDRKNMIDAIRQSYAVLTDPAVSKDMINAFMAPESTSDEDIWRYIQEYQNSTYHMTSTTKMGRTDDEMAVVTTDFNVKGVKGLRVVDMSVAPFVPNCHTVSTAYLIGETAAERLIEEYNLNA